MIEVIQEKNIPRPSPDFCAVCITDLCAIAKRIAILVDAF